MTIESNIELKDYQAFRMFLFSKSINKGFSKSLIIWLIVVFVGTILLNWQGYHLHIPTLIGSGIIFIAILAFSFATSFKTNIPWKDGVILGQKTVVISDEGIAETSDKYNMHLKWSVVKSIEETKDHIFLMIDNHMGNIIPKRDLKEENKIAELIDVLSRYVEAEK
jgi:hypothetical protein